MNIETYNIIHYAQIYVDTELKNEFSVESVLCHVANDLRKLNVKAYFDYFSCQND